jgi:hypothetical protein
MKEVLLKGKFGDALRWWIRDYVFWYVVCRAWTH